MKPPWYDDTKLRKAMYAPGYSGWVIDLGDGTCRYANEPLLGCDDETNPNRDAINANRPRYGDRVVLIERDGELPLVDQSQIIERWVDPLQTGA